MEIKAIDIHVHPPTAEYLESMGKFLEATARYFGRKIEPKSPEEIAEEFRQLQIKAVLLAWDAETNTGLPPFKNDSVAKMAKDHPDVFFAFASVDPWKGEMAIKELERAVKDLGMIGVKFMQTAQGFYPNDRRFYPLWEKCVELRVPVLFHCGTTGLAAGTAGGMGFRLDYVRPIYIDHLAADFPELTIICAHPAWPWVAEAIAIAIHKANVYVDLSGWSPKYFPQELVWEVNSRIQDKALFGTDYPFIAPQRWLADFEKADYKPEVRQKVLLQNAKKVLRL